MNRLTSAMIRDVTKPGRYGDGRGLHLSIAKGGTKSWVLRITVDGRVVDKGLGSFPKVSLMAARKLTDTYRGMVANGENPWDKADGYRKALASESKRIPTYAEAASRLHEAKVQAGGITGKTTRGWIQLLERQSIPHFGNVPVDQINQREIKEYLEQLAAELPETARKVRSQMREVFDDCIEAEYMTVNPAGDGIRLSVKRWSRHHKTTHFKSLPYEDVKGIIDKILSAPGMLSIRLALAFQVLTATRSGEVRGATWDEIDLEAGVWSIPAERMKSDRPHVVPLSTSARQLLQTLTPTRDGLTFPHPSGKPLSENALSLRTRKDGLGCTPHGFRSSFKGWATAQGKWQWEAIELSLAHKVGNSVAQAYFRDNLLEQRRPIMDEWSQYVWPVSAPSRCPRLPAQPTLRALVVRVWVRAAASALLARRRALSSAFVHPARALLSKVGPTGSLWCHFLSSAVGGRCSPGLLAHMVQLRDCHQSITSAPPQPSRGQECMVRCLWLSSRSCRR